MCPVAGPVRFVDSWGAARSGGRSHKGTDMMAAHGTPTVAPTSGEVVHRGTSLGGLSWYVYGDNGHTYYGTHLQGYENQGAGHVEAGTVIGYVGSTGLSTGPHLHYEVIVNGHFVDPMRIRVPRGRELEGRILADFKRQREQVEALLQRAGNPNRFAQRETR